MTKLKKLMRVMFFALVLCLTPITAFSLNTTTCQAMTYDDVKSKVSSFTDGVKRFWDDSAPDRAKLSKKAKKKWKALQKKIAKKYKKAKKQGKKGLKKFRKWRKNEEKKFWKWYQNQLNQ